MRSSYCSTRFACVAALCALGLLQPGCRQPEATQFRLLSPAETGIRFANRIVENDTINILSFEYVYNGGGVGVADFDGDGREDLFFAGNMVPNRLYLNRGDFHFEDVGEAAGIAAADRWCTGVAVVDINADNRPDVYVCAAVHKPGSARANLLFVNQGNDAQGIPHFAEQAAAYGVADTGHSTHAAFLDYDRDGDLDLYVLTNEMERMKRPNQYHRKRIDGSNPNTDRLYRNNGDGTFANVSAEAGILVEGYGLGIAVTDVDRDGWPDLYITNDYLSNDFLLINQRDGTFADLASKALRHTSYSAMGNDAADIDADGRPDLFSLDMLPHGNPRRKMMIGETNYHNYTNNDRYGFNYQYIRNTLQLNRGLSPDGVPAFSEVGQLAGIHETDWSWSPLFADYDNDGLLDLIISNGFPRDVTDHDFGFYKASDQAILDSKWDLIARVPVVRIPNFAYRNRGDLHFEDVTRAWGLDHASFSNGAAFADLDGDGDLDYVCNNINDSAFVFRNTLRDQPGTGQAYLHLVLQGSGANTAALGTQIEYFAGDRRIGSYYHSPYRGYMSSVSTRVHLGLGSVVRLDSVQITWPDGGREMLRDVAADQTLTLRQGSGAPALVAGTPQPLFAAASVGLDLVHNETDFVDFDIQRTLPRKYSQQGPAAAAGDVNGDGLDDLCLGGAAGKPGSIFVQQRDGSFAATQGGDFTQPKPEEDTGLLLFDADGDGDLDLYVCSGSYEFDPNGDRYQDRLYRNDGRGQFRLDPQALPEMRTSTSCVKAADWDHDGDPDLFVGGRVIPGAYPLPPRSFFLQNDQGRFTDVTQERCPAGAELGLISDALFSDVDNDGWVDLLLAGEWMHPTLLRNSEGIFIDGSAAAGLRDYTGWWNSIAGADFDADGDIDYVMGNLGFNTPLKASPGEPVRIFAKDFDRNGSVDPVLSCYLHDGRGGRASYPTHLRLDLIKQLVMIKDRYPSFEGYGKATADALFTPAEMQDALVREAVHMASSYLENQGDGRFVVRALPGMAQWAPLYGLLPGDWNGDGHTDLLAVGNEYGTEVFAGRYDALQGLLLLGDGAGGLAVADGSGFWVPGDAKALVSLRRADGRPLVVATENRGPLRSFVPQRAAVCQPWPTGATYAEISYGRGQRRRVERYEGSSYLSQSSAGVDTTGSTAVRFGDQP
ncbi:MAG: VCBS repeat-containing protein [Bacteroidia bacterium]